MRTFKPSTSNLEEIGWNNNELFIIHDNGTVVKYKNVPEAVYAGLQTAASCGSFINRYIVGNFEYEIVKRNKDNEKVIKIIEDTFNEYISTCTKSEPSIGDFVVLLKTKFV
jgi:hypothetical protein